MKIDRASLALRRQPAAQLHGKVVSAGSLSISVTGLDPWLRIGARLRLSPPAAPAVEAEVVGFAEGHATALAFGPLDGVGPGTPAMLAPSASLAVDETWLGRVLDPLGRPLDGRPPPPPGPLARPVRAAPPQAGQRARLGPRLDLGVRALDAFATCRRGQRLGLFAASGVGKSTLLSMLAGGAAADVVVLALVGERGRELREFLEDDLGAAGLARSVVVCATSDAPPLMRREAAYAAMAIAEHFADQGRQVLLMMDSVTRFAMALREIGLAAGEPPTTRGYTPGVFAELPRLLERAGPREEGCAGAITGLFTVLVEGDDHDEPVADAVRGILDGHVVMDRSIGERGRYPAIDILRSLSRTVPGCLRPDEAALMRRARAVLALHAEMADLVRLGAYRPGADPAVDEAIRLAPRIEAMLGQGKGERGTVESAFAALAAAMEETADAA
ncbi:flagellar protein export ATPase FliI [Siccirubricoccus sp. KC 17139]|uniref:Flagellar protein export ATPase FliI n=1 Tax=Siccirubricoccus soli TaxID=2899147 RepID=A0ABT1D0W1_9PROT|nr:FliI/YscN family ATPase [Siccirubricoccus soli]MCO6414899.1 flagellar protein export ATPase FliI [Siccirubricoccus soli]MCP2681029.1 flagellar protein export ATPase FliI [Siccirubricoccus soli]